MNCPICHQEMEKGFIQSGQTILWAETKHRLSTNPRGEKEFLLAQNPLGGAAVPGFCCRSCRKIILEY